MDNPFVKEKVKAANIIVANYANRVSGQIDCETDMLIEVCKNMYHDIADCFGYSVADEDFYGKYGFEMNIMQEIRQDVEQFKKKYQDRTIVRRAIQMAQPPEVIIKTCGQNYIGDFSDRSENDCEKKLMDVVNAYVKEHSNDYSEWLQSATERSNLPMIGQIGRDYLAGNMSYGCKCDKYPQLRDEEYWLMDAWKAGDGWAAFTHACLCYFGAVRWKVAVECYGKASELLINRWEESKMPKEVKTEDLMGLGRQEQLKGNLEKAVRYYQQAADAGAHDGWYQMGYMYQRGHGVEQSYEKAINWYQKIIDAGDVDGWYPLGDVYEEMEDYDKAVECYEKQVKEGGDNKYYGYYGLAKAYRYGLGREEDFPKALDYYQRAAGNGEIAAMVDLGQLYYDGDGVKQDYIIANYWFEKAANSYNGNYLAFGHLGEAYHHGLGKEVDYDKAKEYYEKALEAGEDNILFWYGQIYYDEDNYDEAFDCFQRAAVDGNQFQAEAEEYIGKMYQFGEGVEEDFGKAVEWYQKAANNGNAAAMRALGAMYSRGDGVEQDAGHSAYWSLQAAKLGDVIAMNNIGYCYGNGEGVEQDYVAALAWYMRAADYGDEDAMNEIGDIYYFGNGVEKDYSIAKEWFEKAIAAGNETPLMPLGTIYYYNDDFDKAMELYLKAANDENTYQHIAEARIGDLYVEGSGVEQDMAKAVEWYEKSAAHGYATAMLSLGDIYCDGGGNVKQDLTKAKEWYEKAKDAGSEDAEQRLADLS